MTTAYFTFGQCHSHNLGGQVFDKDCVVKITATDPRAEMFKLFKRKWSMEYSECPDMKWFPRGIVHLTYA